MPRRVWKIVGYDATKNIYSGEVPGTMTTSEIVRLLERLACRHLTHAEIVSVSLRRNFVGHNNLLACRINMDGHCVILGSNPHYVATLVEVS
jgi:hypothetical protein